MGGPTRRGSLRLVTVALRSILARSLSAQVGLLLTLLLTGFRTPAATRLVGLELSIPWLKSLL